MSYRQIEELESRVDYWREISADGARRVRSYQRDLLACRRLSPRPHNSVQLLLRMCAVARKNRNLSTSHLAGLRREIRELSGAAAQ